MSTEGERMTESIGSQDVLLENLRRMAESLSSPQGQQVTTVINNNLQEGPNFLHSSPSSFLVAKKLVSGNNNRENDTDTEHTGDKVLVNGVSPAGREWSNKCLETSSMDGSSLYDEYEESEEDEQEAMDAMAYEAKLKTMEKQRIVADSIVSEPSTTKVSNPGSLSKEDAVVSMKPYPESVITADECKKLTTVLKSSSKDMSGEQTEGEQEIICSECGTDFTDVQSYMSHGCVQSSEESNDAKNSAKLKFHATTPQMEEIPSDAESFDGKIVYNPDGSAYIIEGESEFSDEESLLDMPQKDGIIIDQRGKINTSQVQPIPQIASAFYIQKNPAFYNPWYSMLPPENRPRAEAPIMHSYRVFDVRTGKHDEPHSEDNNDSPKATKVVDLKSGDITSVPTKPILMCFICKLSFGYAKSFVSHALAEHSMNLNDEEKCYLARKNASAIIQGIGIAKDPLMSFLEPISPPITKGEGSAAKSFIPPGVFSSKLKASDARTSVSFVHSGSKVTPFEQKHNSLDSNTSSKFNNLHSSVMSSRHSPNVSNTPGFGMPSQDDTDVQNTSATFDDRPESLSSNDTLLTSSNTTSLLKSPGHKASVRDSSPVRGDINNSSVSKFQSPSNSSSPGSSSSMPPLTSPPPLGSGSAHLPVSPKISLPNIPVPPLVPVSTAAATSQGSPVQGIVIRAGCEDHPNGNITGDECLKCDTVLGTARSQMGPNMTMMHSRNSCKTLKCPKCNWHYKYQETLEIHMKEKHPDSDTQCIYCITKQAHPRLARGEVYTCGYKPYRCEVCNYSTTTKGNLSIHMQSDKHINNMQELQKAQSAGTVPPSQLPPTPSTPNGNHISPISSTVSMEVHIPPTTSPISATSTSMNEPSSFKAANANAAKSTQKPKPSWRCDVCNYETNVARNLRIHMTSEKHTHNMMMLQQNVKHMQRDMHFQLNQMALMGPDPGMMYGLPNPLGPGVPPFPFDPSMLMPPGLPNPLSSEGPMDLTKQENEQQVNAKCLDFNNKANNEVSKLFQCTICDSFSADCLESLHSHMQLDRTKHGNEEHVTVINGTYICNLCQYKTNLKANFQLHCKTDKHLQRLQLVNHIREGSHNTSDEWQMKYFANISNPVQVRCTACNYYTNSIHKLQLHNSTPRHESSAKLFHHLQKQEGEVNTKKKYYHCALCKANCKSKLGLIDHVKTMTHMRNESLKILQHQEQGREVEFSADAIFLVRELKEDDHMGFEEDSMPKDTVSLSGEVQGAYGHFAGHQNPHSDLLASTALTSSVAASSAVSEKVMHLPSVTSTATLRDEHKERTSDKLYACPFCKFNSASEERLEVHVNSQHRAKAPTKEQPSEDIAPVREMACPLCQEKYMERHRIESHLVEVHNVSNEGLHRLLGLLDAQSLSASMMSLNNAMTQSSSPATLLPSNGVLNLDLKVNTGTHDFCVEDSAMNEDQNDPVAEMIEKHALKLAEEASKDGINVSELISPTPDQSQPLEEQFRCQTCAKTFQNIDNLYNHQNELGHLELKQTPRGPGYLCWKKGCNQYFKTAQALQVHFREIHAKKPAVLMSVSEKHMYKFRCTQCSLAFKTVDKLQLHSVYHVIRNATQCCVCSRRFKTILAMRKHVESTHINTMTPAEKEQYAASQLALLGMPGMDGSMGLQNNVPIESLKALQRGVQFPLPIMGFPDVSMSALLKHQTTDAHHDELPSKAHEEMVMQDVGRDDERVLMEVDEDITKEVVDESINTIALAENSYNDSSKKYKCHRCKVAFAKQNLIIQHNRTSMHKAKASKSSSSVPSPVMSSNPASNSFKSGSPCPMDQSDPKDLTHCATIIDSTSQADSKCNTCEDLAADKNPLVSRNVHLQMLKDAQEKLSSGDHQKSYNSFSNKEHTINNNNKPQTTQILTPSDIQAKNQSVANNNDSTKPYKCNICKVSYKDGSVLDEHLESPQHQTKALKIEELIVTGEVDMTQPLIEKPETNAKPSVQTPKQKQVTSQEAIKQVESTGKLPALPFSQAAPLLFGNFPGFPSQSSMMTTSQGQLQLPVVSSSIANMMLNGGMTSSALSAMTSMAKSKSEENCIYTTAGKTTANVDATEVKKDIVKSVSKEIISPIKKESKFICEKCNGHFDTAESLVKHQQMYCLMQMSSLRFKLHVQRNLLENIGFECVMQYNEYLQKPKKTKKSQEHKLEDDAIAKSGMNKDNNTASDKSHGLQADSCNNNKPVDLKSNDNAIHRTGGIPEMERSVCKTCSKQFSSIWVLKTHEEEVHKEVIPTDLVTVVADKFREEFDQKYPQGLSEGCNMDVAGMIADSGKDTNSTSHVPAVSSKSEEPQISSLAADLASAQAAQMLPMPMFNVLPGMMPLPISLPVNLPPHLMPVMMPLPPNEMMSLPGLANMMDPNLINNQSQVSAAAAVATSSAALAAQQKRGRTRISDEQLKVLRAHFDINNSPSEEQISKMSEQTALLPKVIKHWFRNTLFKERQRNKDSPYNFSVPPSTQLNLEEYEKTGTWKTNNQLGPLQTHPEANKFSPASQPSESSPFNSKVSMSNPAVPAEQPKPIVIEPQKDIPIKESKPAVAEQVETKIEDGQDQESVTSSAGESLVNSAPSTPLPTTPVPVAIMNPALSMSSIISSTSSTANIQIPSVSSPVSLPYTSPNSLNGNNISSTASLGLSFPPLLPMGANQAEMSAAFARVFSTPEKKRTDPDGALLDFKQPVLGNPEAMSGANTPSTPGTPANMSSFMGGRRANRTRFSDYQLKILQEYFEQNAYPKDDDLDHLSKLLNLSPRVIVVWFQNARQKARKSYENNPPAPLSTPEDDSKFNRTPGLNYQCKRCLTVFQRYYELIRHQKTQCYKDDDDRSETNNSSCHEDDPLDDADSSDISQKPTSQPMSSSSKEQLSPPGPVEYKCEKCTAVFPRFDLWKEHQSFHMLNPSLFSPQSSQAAVNPFVSFPPLIPGLPSPHQFQAHLATMKQEELNNINKRKLEEDDDDRDDYQGQKRMRTTILPEQLDYLYQQYQLDCNPSRKQLEAIADHVGLKKRVVQVWFQNTRARERKGQYRAHTQIIHKRCPFCRALFRAKTALESHLATKHPEDMARGQVNIDALPDEPWDAVGPSGSSTPTTPTSSGGNVPGLDMAKLLSNPYSMPNQFMPLVPGGGLGGDQTIENMDATMKKMYEDSLKRYMSDLNAMKEEKKEKNGSSDSKEKQISEEIPLDLSKPVDLSRALKEESQEESVSWNDSDNEISMTDSGPPSPCSTTSSAHTHSVSVTSPQQQQLQNHMLNVPPKRYRTQLSALQVKIMKSIYQFYKTPTMSECEMLGRVIGLAKRVIQVWFQNARAKEKKAKASQTQFQTSGYNTDLDIPPPPEECKLCDFKYSHKYTLQDHLFSRRHIEKVSTHIQATDRDLAVENAGVTGTAPSGGGGNGKTSWDKNEALAQMNALGLNPMSHIPAAMAGAGIPGLSEKLRESSASTSEKKMKEDKTGSAKKPDSAKSSLAGTALPPGIMNPFSSLPGVMPGMLDASMAASGMLPFMMPGMGGAGMMPGMPGMGGLPFMPMGMMPGPEMFMYDPATYGTPLTLLQIPQQAIKSVQNKLQDEGCIITRYTQDCKNLPDLKSLISATDFACSGESMVDVGYICRKCQMVYPGKEACLNHQQAMCYSGKSLSHEKSIVKLEQIQYNCRACDLKFSTLQEYKVHCDMDGHKKKVRK